MAKLTAARRKAMPASSFAYPSVRKYPIHDRSHAKAALRLAGKKSTYGTYAGVAKAVKKKYPDIKTKTATRSSTSRKKK